jgi:hypothetical protein
VSSNSHHASVEHRTHQVLTLSRTVTERTRDARLLGKLRREDLIPLGSRIRTRLATEAATRDDLLACLDHLLASAGNASLMTRELRNALVDHAAGNYRVFISMAGELLMSAAQREITTLDEKLYLQVFARPDTPAARRSADLLNTDRQQESYLWVNRQSCSTYLSYPKRQSSTSMTFSRSSASASRNITSPRCTATSTTGLAQIRTLGR